MRISDETVLALIAKGRVRVDHERGLVFSPFSNNPKAPLGSKSKGYLRARISGYGEIMVHRIVCIATHGLPPIGRPLVNHKNAIKNDNVPTNLEWASNAENLKHAGANGLLGANIRGPKNWRAKLSARQVKQLREKYVKAKRGRQRAPRGMVAAWCNKYGMSRRGLIAALSGRTYRTEAPDAT